MSRQLCGVPVWEEPAGTSAGAQAGHTGAQLKLGTRRQVGQARRQAQVQRLLVVQQLAGGDVNRLRQLRADLLHGSKQGLQRLQAHGVPLPWVVRAGMSVVTEKEGLSIEQLAHHQCGGRAPSCMILNVDMPGLELT